MPELPETEIGKNIIKLRPHIKIICALIRNCAKCDKFEHCIEKMVDAAGITDDMLVNSLYNRIHECKNYEEKGMSWNLNLKGD